MVSITNKVSAHEKILFSIDIVRHGDRTSLFEIPNIPNKFPYEMGELTPLGMRQLYDLGTKLRKLYLDDYQLLSKTYNSQEIYVRSTGFSRTLNSAQCLLLVLYSGSGPSLGPNQEPALPGSFQPVPIFSALGEEDSLLVTNFLPKLKDMQQKLVFQSKQYLEQEQLYESKISKWNSLLGLNIKNLQELIPLGDYLNVSMKHKFPNLNNISDTDRDEIISASEWSHASGYSHPEIGLYVSQNLRLAIGKYLHDVTASQIKLKYVLFSAHDTSIMGIMSGLGIPLVDKSPPYASNLNFLLTQDSKGQNYLKLSLNDEELYLPGCNNTRCSLENFLQFCHK